jgi:hypothetical protein
MYGVTVNSFTRYSIDTFNIEGASRVNISINNAENFINEFHRIINDRKRIDSLEFDYKLIRILYQIQYKGGKQDKILVDGHRCLLYNKSKYYIDKTLREFLVSPIPEKDRMSFWSYKEN